MLHLHKLFCHLHGSLIENSILPLAARKLEIRGETIWGYVCNIEVGSLIMGIENTFMSSLPLGQLIGACIFSHA